MPQLMYTPHPDQSRLQAFVPPSLVRAAEKDFAVKFSELLEMRRVIEEMASNLQDAQPDLVPFFATGGIPFMFPAMHVLYDRKAYGLVDGRHFHMFPGLSWRGKLNGMDSESYFATEYGKLILSAMHEDGSLCIWTMDATFTCNAVRKLLKALHRAFQDLPTPPLVASVFLLAVIDASRADDQPDDDKLPLHSPYGTFYLLSPAEYSPTGELIDRQPLKFVRNNRDDQAAELAQKIGTVANRRKSAQEELTAANDECQAFAETRALPEIVLHATEELNEAELQRHRDKADEHLQMASEFDAEGEDLANRLDAVSREREILGKDERAVESLLTSNQDQFDRLVEYLVGLGTEHGEPRPSVHQRGADDLANQISALELELQGARSKQLHLDVRRDEVAQEIGNWSRQEKFLRFPDSVSHRFAARRALELESKGEFFVQQLDDTVFQIEQKLEEANKHHDRVVNIVLAAVEEGLSLLKQISSMSRLPEGLPQAGKHFVVIETKAAESPAERRARVADLIDELLQTGDIGKDDMALIQKAVRRVAGRTRVRVLHPDLHHASRRVMISEMRRLSGGERLTAAILLFCALVRLRHAEQGRRGSSVLVLDNPIGTASRQSFLDLQREVAQSMNVQLIYATGIKDLSAVGALENIIRLRNSRADRRTGRRLVEVEDQHAETDQIGLVEATRVTFDAPPSSLVHDNGEDTSPKRPTRKSVDDAVRD